MRGYAIDTMGASLRRHGVSEHELAKRVAAELADRLLAGRQRSGPAA